VVTPTEKLTAFFNGERVNAFKGCRYLSEWLGLSQDEVRKAAAELVAREILEEGPCINHQGTSWRLKEQ